VLLFDLDIVRGGIFAECYFGCPAITYHDDAGETHEEENRKHSFKLSLAPEFDMSDWRYIGIALNSVLGYTEVGDAVLYAGERDDDESIAAFFSTVNLGLDFAFKNLRLELLRLAPNLFYSRDNYDVADRCDTFGANLAASLSGFPLELQAEFGYKHFNLGVAVL
jgi:hypothetical protein